MGLRSHKLAGPQRPILSTAYRSQNPRVRLQAINLLFAVRRLLDPVAQGDDGPQGLHGGDSVVVLLGFRKVFVGHQVRVGLRRVVPLGAVAPTLADPLRGPEVVGVPCQKLGQLPQVLARTESGSFRT